MDQTPEQKIQNENIERPKKKCLFIDDYPLIILSAKLFFSDFDNFTVVECHSVEEAKEAIKANSPDIVFLDHSLTVGGNEGIVIADYLKETSPDTEIYSTTTNLNNLPLYEQRGIKSIGKSDLQKMIDIANS